MDLRHYYHLYADGDYREIVIDHFRALRLSGLGKALSHLHIGFVGNAENVATAQRLVAQLVKRPFTVSTAETGWEQETLAVLHADCLAAQTPFFALYAHTKGAAIKLPVNPPWRKIMTSHTVTNWRQAIAVLRGNVAAAGCFWAPFDNGRIFNIAEGTQYFAGNFWWARSDAIARIAPPSRVTRFDAEGWIGFVTKLPQPYAVSCLFDAPLDVDSLSRYTA